MYKTIADKEIQLCANNIIRLGLQIKMITFLVA